MEIKKTIFKDFPAIIRIAIQPTVTKTRPIKMELYRTNDGRANKSM